MKLFSFAILSAVAALSLLSACDKKVGKKPAANAVSCDSVTYTKHIRPLVDLTCVKSGCHDEASQAGGVVLTTYDQLKVLADQGRIRARVIDGNPTYMPQDHGPLPDGQMALIKCWLEKGAPSD